MFITALCPSYRRPVLLSNSLMLWLHQIVPAETRRELLILDDSGVYDNQEGENWRLVSLNERLPSLPAKYNKMLELAHPDTDAFLVWEDDDIYLAGYLFSYLSAFEDGCDYVKPETVLSDYTGNIQVEPSTGRFHSSLGFTKKLIQDIGGWPETSRADFDQMLIAKLNENSEKKCSAPFGKTAYTHEYIFSWHTGHPHGQHAMRGGEDVTWYHRAGSMNHPPSQRIGKLIPATDARTEKLTNEMKNHRTK